MFFDKLFIRKSEPCPCGSDKKYIDCCFNKIDKLKANSKKPPEVLALEFLNRGLFKCCLYPDNSRCTKQIKKAHALQNNGIISKLQSDGHVYILNTKKKPLLLPMENGDTESLTLIDKVGVSNATTYTCFCHTHDDEVFADIEKGSVTFDMSNKKQLFLYAYKAFIFDYYKELVMEKSLQKQVAQTPSILQKRIFVAYYRMLKKRMVDLNRCKEQFDRALLQGDYSIINTHVVEFPYEIKFANYACIAFEYDLEGRRIKNLDRKADVQKRAFVTTFPEREKSYFLFSYLAEDSRTYNNMGFQLESFDIDKIKFYLNYALPLYSENVVISPDLWESWNEEVQMAYTYFANINGNREIAYSNGLSFHMKNIKNKNIEITKKDQPKINLFS